MAKQTVPALQSDEVQHGCVQKLVMPAALNSPVVTVNDPAQIPLVQAEAPAHGQPTAPGQGPEVSGMPVSTGGVSVSPDVEVSGIEVSGGVLVSVAETSIDVPESTIGLLQSGVEQGTQWLVLSHV